MITAADNPLSPTGSVSGDEDSASSECSNADAFEIIQDSIETLQQHMSDKHATIDMLTRDKHVIATLQMQAQAIKAALNEQLSDTDNARLNQMLHNSGSTTYQGLKLWYKLITASEELSNVMPIHHAILSILGDSIVAMSATLMDQCHESKEAVNANIEALIASLTPERMANRLCYEVIMMLFPSSTDIQEQFAYLKDSSLPVPSANPQDVFQAFKLGVSEKSDEQLLQLAQTYFDNLDRGQLFDDFFGGAIPNFSDVFTQIVALLQTLIIDTLKDPTMAPRKDLIPANIDHMHMPSPPRVASSNPTVERLISEALWHLVWVAHAQLEKENCTLLSEKITSLDDREIDLLASIILRSAVILPTEIERLESILYEPNSHYYKMNRYKPMDETAEHGCQSADMWLGILQDSLQNDKQQLEALQSRIPHQASQADGSDHTDRIFIQHDDEDIPLGRSLLHEPMMSSVVRATEAFAPLVLQGLNNLLPIFSHAWAQRNSEKQSHSVSGQNTTLSLQHPDEIISMPDNSSDTAPYHSETTAAQRFIETTTNQRHVDDSATELGLFRNKIHDPDTHSGISITDHPAISHDSEEDSVSVKHNR